MKKILPLLVLVLCSTTLFSQTIYYVKPTGNDANNGTSWTTAFKTLQKALATISSGQVWVAAGTYYPDEGPGLTNNSIGLAFQMKNNVAIYGGFAGTETALSQRNWTTHKTILSGDIDQVPGNAGNSFHVIYNNMDYDTDNGLKRSAVLDGFIITDAYNPPSDGGGGGGGLIQVPVKGGPSPSIASNNSLSNFGGAIFNHNASPTIINCIITKNAGYYFGGGVYNNYYSSPLFINCTISENTISGAGTTWGAAICNDYYSSSTLISCTIWGNRDLSSAYGGIANASYSSSILTNCILWGNSGNQFRNWPGSATVTYSIVQGGFSGTGNLNRDPLFVNATGGDLRLHPCSPAIDAGTNTANTPAVDLGGNPRILFNTIDMGAYESPTNLCCPDGNTLFVKKDATGNNNGSTWAHAFTSLQDALAHTSLCANVTQVWVAAGTYYPDESGASNSNDRTASFVLKNNLAIYGGFAGTETTLEQRAGQTNATILSGEIQQDADSTNNAYHVVRGSSLNATAVLDGFTIKGGNAQGDVNNDRGGGLYNNGASPAISNCVFTGNTASFGGALCNYNTSSPTLTNCRFLGNRANYGGGMYNDNASAPTLVTCHFSGNQATEGGGLYNNSASPRLTSCIFSGNTAANSGGGIYNFSASAPTLTNCCLLGNRAGVHGGALYNNAANPTMINCSFWGNNAAYSGGIYNVDASPVVTNCILWGNTPNQVMNLSGTPAVTYSLIQGGYTGTGNLSADPLFVDAAGGDLHLQPCSPAINAGNTAVVIPSTDLDGKTRVMSYKVDMGVYEFQPSVESSTLYVRHDATGNNDGTSWTHAFTHLQDALAKAATCPGITQIWIAKGVYYPDETATANSNDRSASFRLSTGLAIYGGFAGTETEVTRRNPLLNETVLSGEIQGDGDSTNNAYHVVTAAGVNETTVLSGVTISGGHASGASPDDRGGGLYIVSAYPSISDCVFRGNAATYGGAIYAATPSTSATLFRCSFSGNTAVRGGALYNALTSVVQLFSCRFTQNTASDQGGAVYNNFVLRGTNCLFWSNTATLQGSAVYNNNAFGTAIVNSSFYGNTAVGGTGGALYNNNSSPTLTNIILWGNTGGQVDNDATSTPSVTYSLVQGGYAGGRNILDGDPQFVNAPFGDLHLRGCSPALDAGDNSADTRYEDLDGKNRIVDGRVDLGAYEFQPGGAPGILYVDDDAPPGGDGSSWSRAFRSLQEALTKAGTCKGTQVWVANGIYYPDETGTNRAASFDLKPEMALYGGFSGTETDLSQRTPMTLPSWLSGDIDQDGTPAGNSYHVVRCLNANAGTVLDGFVITAGNANGTDTLDQRGGAMVNDHSAPRVNNCTFWKNRADGNGGGVFNHASSPAFTNCLFLDNSTLADGGALYNRIYSSPVFINCTFSMNQADFRGGAVMNYYQASPTLVNCTIASNTAIWGGAIGSNYNSSPLITNSILWGNSSGLYSTSGSTPVATYSIVQDGYSGTGNINADPHLIEVTNGANLHLRGCSPAIDAGNPAAVTTGTDLDGNARIAFERVDMGAYEFQPGGANSILYVNDDAPAGGDGTSWAKAYTKLQDALAKAGTCRSSTMIWVAAGTYYPDEGTGLTDNDRSQSFQLRTNTAIYGGFAGTERDPTERVPTTQPSILNGDIDKDGSLANNAYHVVMTSSVDATAVLDGFTITGGNANGSDTLNSRGGGMYNILSSATIANCRFTGNAAADRGGGIYNMLSAPAFTRCSFSQNRAAYGGGVYNVSSDANLTNCRFWNNTADSYGGAITNQLSAPSITYCSLSGNTAAAGGGITNLTAAPTITNSILWGNSSGMDNLASTPVVTYSLVQGGYTGTGNIDTDPLFVDAAGGDLHLQACSPAIDAGNKAIVSTATDLDGQPRTVVLQTDMGAYEFQGTIMYVQASATGLNDGTSWTNAFTRLQDALAVSTGCSKLTMIWVAKGVYYPDETAAANTNARSASFHLKANVAVLGGFAGTETALSQRSLNTMRTNETILSGDIDQVAGNTNNSYHVVQSAAVDATAILDGFTISGAKADGNTPVDLLGAGLYNAPGSSPTITNCLFTANYAARDGGAIYNDTASAPIIISCRFLQNKAYNGGGAIFNQAAAPTIVNGVFWKNSVNNYGGALNNNGSSPAIINSTFWGNTALYGGGIYNANANPSITNCILWGSNQIRNTSSAPVITYSIVQGGYSGEGNLSTDPLFVNAEAGDLHLQPASPAVNAGSNAAVPPTVTKDIAGLPRIFIDRVDMGAYELYGGAGGPEPSKPLTLICPDDFTVSSDGGACGAVADFTGAQAATVSGGEDPVTLTYEPAPGTVLPVGETFVTVTAMDATRRTRTCIFWVTVVDATPPVISNITVDQPLLYPPNHKLQDITVSYEVSDCSEVTTTLSVSSNEPQYGTGSGDAGPDWEIIDNHKVKLRAERAGKGDDRVYTITITAKDAAGNESSATTTVTVPHDQAGPLTAAEAGGGLRVHVRPNPSTNGFTLTVQSPSPRPLTLRVLDAAGRVMESRSGIAPNGVLHIGTTYRPGVYHAQVLQGDVRQTIKLVKQAP